MPPELTAVLAGLAVQAGPGEFTAVEQLAGGSFPGPGGLRRDPVAVIDATGLTWQEARDRLSGLPAGQDDSLQVAWIAGRAGARMSFAASAANIGDLWFPAMDDIVAVAASGSPPVIPILDHGELITLSGMVTRAGSC